MLVNYAIGDVHGKSEMLLKLLDIIEDDVAANYSLEDDITVIFLGDYVDRGENSKGVIDTIINYDTFPSVSLMGNHELMMLDAVGRPESFPQRKSLESWALTSNGGKQTLASYGIDATPRIVQMNDVAALQRQVGDEHLTWLAGLRVKHETPLAYYVHAGITINRPWEEQEDMVCLWSRDRLFLAGMFDVGKPVVHGHTPQNRACRAGNSIGVDTGAVFGGSLSAVVLDDSGRENYLSVEPEEVKTDAA